MQQSKHQQKALETRVSAMMLVLNHACSSLGMTHCLQELGRCGVCARARACVRACVCVCEIAWLCVWLWAWKTVLKTRQVCMPSITHTHTQPARARQVRACLLLYTHARTATHPPTHVSPHDPCLEELGRFTCLCVKKKNHGCAFMPTKHTISILLVSLPRVCRFFWGSCFSRALSN